MNYHKVLATGVWLKCARFKYVGKQFNTSLTGLAHDNMTPTANRCGVAEPKQEYNENGSMEKLYTVNV